jgi:hypothetical protein
MNNGKLHVGKDVWRPGVKCFLDELKIYNKALKGNILFYLIIIYS